MDIKTAKSVILIPKPSTDTSIWLATEVLLKALKKNDKIVYVYTKNENLHFSKKFIPEGVKIFDEDRATDLVITLSNVNQKIKSVDWKQESDSLEIIIKSENKDVVRPDVAISSSKNDFELKIFIGMTKKVASNEPAISRLELTKDKSYFFEEKDFIRQIASIVKNLGELNSNSAGKLFTALNLWTDGFRKNIAKDAFLLSQELLASGAKFLPEYLTDNDGPSEEKEDTKEDSESAKESNDGEIKQNDLPDVKDKKEEETEVVEVLPLDFDPLLPASEIPQALKLEKEEPLANTDNSPLPSA